MVMIETTGQNERQMIQGDPRVAAIRSEMEATRAAFHQLASTLPASKWNQKSQTSDWTYGQILFHLTWALENLPQEVASARLSKGMYNLPKGISDKGAYWLTVWMARRATRETLLRRYDQAMDAAISLLERVPVDEWQRGALFFGEGFHSVEDLLHQPGGPS
jgi:hypothetical protein